MYVRSTLQTPWLPNVGLLPGHRLRRWPGNKPALVCVVMGIVWSFVDLEQMEQEGYRGGFTWGWLHQITEHIYSALIISGHNKSYPLLFNLFNGFSHLGQAGKTTLAKANVPFFGLVRALISPT